jgi:hypothetical protein
MECLAVYDDEWLALYVILVFVAFISGMFLGASISRNGRKEREPWYARAVAAGYARAIAVNGGPGSDGKARSANLLAFVIAFVVGVVVLDHFTGPLFPDVFYSRK